MLDMNQFWVITLFIDDGTPETGMHPDGWEDIYMGTVEHAWNDAIKQNKELGAYPTYIRQATKKEVMEYIKAELHTEPDNEMPW